VRSSPYHSKIVRLSDECVQGHSWAADMEVRRFTVADRWSASYW